MNTPTHEAVKFRANGISKRFGQVTALDGVTLELRAGEVTALVGENGAGKSTLLKILGGDYQPDSGQLSFDGVVTKFTDPAEARRQGMRIIAQEPEIIHHVSVAENIYVGTLSALGLGFSRRALEKKATEHLQRYGFDRVISASTIGSDLSAAQRQVVEIMRAIIDEPKVVCFDEPTSSLGEEESALLFKLVNTLRSEGKAVAYVSHRMPEIFQLSDRITVLRDGQLVETLMTADTNNTEIVKHMVGRDLSQLFNRERNTPGAEVLKISQVTTNDVQDINLVVHANEVVGIAGLVGAGRSELLKAIVGDLPVLSGEIQLEGKAVRFSSPADAVAAKIGFAPEERKAEALIMQRTVRDNASLAILKSISSFFFVSRKKEHDLAEKYVQQLRVRTPSIEQLVRNLSGGNQQKVVLARWLALGPKLLLLDEPTRGVDVGAKAEIYAIIDQLAQSGVGVLVVSSELPEVLGLADRIYVMAGGRIAGELDHKSASEESILTLAMTENVS